jgi:hypothetical protein
MQDKCPQCGGRIQATVPVYLDNVALDGDGRVASFALAFTDDPAMGGGFAFDHEATRLYCENDHTVEHKRIDFGRIPTLALREDA